MIQLIEARNTDLQVVRHSKQTHNPATLYIMGLESELSRVTMISHLRQIVRLVTGSDEKSPVDVFKFPWSKLDRLAFQSIIAMMNQRGYSPESIKTYMAAIRGIMAEALELKLIDAEHLQSIRKVKRPRGSRVSTGRSLSIDEAQVLLESCTDSTPTGIRDKAMIALLFGCGLRRSELVSIKFEDYHPEKGCLLISGKGNKQREVFLTENGTKALDRWITKVRGTGTGAMFVRVWGSGRVASLTKTVVKNGVTQTIPNFLTSQSVFYILDKKQKELGMDSFSPHDLRRTLATTLLELGEDLGTVRDVLGHSSVNTTQKYDMRSKDRTKKAVQRTGF